MNIQEFITRYATTLHIDIKTQEKYTPIPIDNLEELTYMHHALIHAIMAVNQVREFYPKDTENSIYWLCRILLSSYPQDELEGISEFLKQSKKI